MGAFVCGRGMRKMPHFSSVFHATAAADGRIDDLVER
jgi:hypothetical protein